MKTETQKIKHSGAGWLLSLTESAPQMSDFGVKVANILGQVGLGIYHYQRDLFSSNRPDWSSDRSIIVVLFRELATFDGSELTLLVLCARAAGVSINIRGRCSHFTEITFLNYQHSVDYRDLMPDAERFNEETPMEDFVVRMGLAERWGSDCIGGNFLIVPRFRRERHKDHNRETGAIKALELSVSNERPIDFETLVESAHDACIRVGVVGLSHQSMAFALHKRQGRTGNFWERHPDFEPAKNTLRPYWDIDYLSRD